MSIGLFTSQEELLGGNNMIHTFKISIPLHYQEVLDLQRRFSIKYTEVNKYFEGVFPGVTMSITYGYGKWKLNMFVDAIKLLGDKSDIIEADYSNIEKEIKYILWYVVGHASGYKHHTLLRIDYRFDAIIDNADHRMLLMHIYRKLTKSYRFQKKYLGKLNNNVFVPYKTSVYHSSKSVESIVYLKEEERIDKGEIVEDYEKSVVRYEVRLKQDHLYYMEKKNKNIKRSRKLWVYMQDDVYKKYFRKYMSHIYHPGDFYKIDAAREKLKNTSLSAKNKEKLIHFLKQVSSHSIDTPLKHMSYGTYKSRLTLLASVGINPILIPKNYQPSAPSFLKNPLNDFPC